MALALLMNSALALGEQVIPTKAMDEKIGYINDNADDALFAFGKGFYLHKPQVEYFQNADEVFNNPEYCAILTGYIYGELGFLILTNNHFREMFNGEVPQALTSETSFVGKDGNILSTYLQTSAQDYFALYDVEDQVISFIFLNDDVELLAEEELFKICSDGYHKNESEHVETFLPMIWEPYQKNGERIYAGVPNFNEIIAMAREKDLYTKDASLKFGHQPFLYKLDASCEDEMILAVLFSELNTLQRIGANKELKKSLAKIDFTPDLSKPAYSGRDGDVVSAYLQGTKCGFFFIYDIASNTMTYGFVRPDAADRVEAELFQNCTGGYQTLNTDMLKNWLESTTKTYSQF